MKKYHTAHQMFRATNGFTKKPSAKYIREQKKKEADSYRNAVADYDERVTIIENGVAKTHIEKASEKKFGIFNKKGYRALQLFYTREEAEECLKTFRMPQYYEIREIEWFEEDKENN